MRGECRVISDKSSLLTHFHSLTADDIITSIIPFKSGEEHLLFDLVARGIRLVPSAVSQLASRSKAYQAAIFSPWMIPDTAVIYDTHHLLALSTLYNRKKIGRVVLKQERKNAGIGILLYNSIEEVYNQAANNVLKFPFVLQPFIDNSIDLRVVLLGDYLESYQRHNPHNFRNNLHCGGKAKPHPLSDDALNLCRSVMQRGAFPYAHLDLMVTDDGTTYLSEINLRGGLRGARISSQEYRKRTTAIEKEIADSFLSRVSTPDSTVK